MSYRVVIPTAGIGSRLEDLTKYINKALVSVANRPIISHLIEQFPKDCEFVIALGYKGKLVRDFLELSYPNRVFHFEKVYPYEGEGSGLGHSLLACEKHLQQPFVFLSCDTLVKEAIPKPNQNWMGYAHRMDLTSYRTLRVINNTVSEICEKKIVKDKLNAYIGLAGIHDYQKFWQAMHSGESLAIEQGESYGMKSILKDCDVSAYQFSWLDTGNIKSIKVAREEYSNPNEPNILEKGNEAIWFVGDTVIKYSDDVNFISNRIKRVNQLKGFVPNISVYRPNMYCYKKVKGKVLSEVVDLPIFENLLTECKVFWLKSTLNAEESRQFKDNCLKFYKNKTFERVELFYKNFDKKDNVRSINDETTPLLKDLLNQIDWEFLSKGLAGRFHGDFHFENILFIEDTKKFKFLDWRQDFCGDLLVGDIYYDLAKLMHGLIVNHGIIVSNQYNVYWEGNDIKYHFNRKPNLVECEKRFAAWIQENNYDLKKVKILTAIIFLNIAALHHYPYSLLLYGLGKSMLNIELNR